MIIGLNIWKQCKITFYFLKNNSQTGLNFKHINHLQSSLYLQKIQCNLIFTQDHNKHNKHINNPAAPALDQNTEVKLYLCACNNMANLGIFFKLCLNLGLLDNVPCPECTKLHRKKIDRACKITVVRIDFVMRFIRMELSFDDDPDCSASFWQNLITCIGIIIYTPTNKLVSLFSVYTFALSRDLAGIKFSLIQNIWINSKIKFTLSYIVGPGVYNLHTFCTYRY